MKPESLIGSILPRNGEKGNPSMCTPYGPVCDHCGQPIFVTIGTFFFPEQRFCSVECLEAKDAERRQEARSKDFYLRRGWIDCAGKCRTWKVADGNGAHIAEVTRKRDALLLISLLSGHRRASHV
jgi:hypothetical protein